MKNWIELKHIPLFRWEFAYLDTVDNLADRFFINHEVTVKFGDEFQNGKFKLILASCRKADKNKAIAALSDFQKQIPLLGVTGYNEMCEHLNKAFEKM